jgi:hypothetical protein
MHDLVFCSPRSTLSSPRVLLPIIAHLRVQALQAPSNNAVPAAPRHPKFVRYWTYFHRDSKAPDISAEEPGPCSDASQYRHEPNYHPSPAKTYIRWGSPTGHSTPAPGRPAPNHNHQKSHRTFRRCPIQEAHPHGVLDSPRDSKPGTGQAQPTKSCAGVLASIPLNGHYRVHSISQSEVSSACTESAT